MGNGEQVFVDTGAWVALALTKDPLHSLAVEAWQQSLAEVVAARPLECRPADLDEAWPYFRRTDLHKLSAVDATSFVLMKREKIRVAFAFDHHFGSVGFRLVG